MTIIILKNGIKKKTRHVIVESVCVGVDHRNGALHRTVKRWKQLTYFLIQIFKLAFSESHLTDHRRQGATLHQFELYYSLARHRIAIIYNE